MDFSLQFMMTAIRASLHYVPTTLFLAVVPLLLGSVIGMAIALIRLFKIPFAATFLKWVVIILKAIPLVLVLLVTYLMTSDFFDQLAVANGWSIGFKDVNPIWIVIFSLTQYAMTTLAEAFRSALESVPKGQYDAAYSVGLTRWQLIRRILIPQAFPIAFPMISSTLIGLVKASSLAFMVSVVDVLNGALIEANSNYRFLEVYVAASIVYWAICAVIENLSKRIEEKFNKEVRSAMV